MSAFVFGGVPRDAVRRVMRTAVDYVSEDLLAEYRAVPLHLLDAGKITDVQWRALVAGMAAFVADARLVVPKRRVRLCRDPADDMVLECCVAAGADYLVTGDRDLLSLSRGARRPDGLGRLRIVTPRSYLAAE